MSAFRSGLPLVFFLALASGGLAQDEAPADEPAPAVEETTSLEARVAALDAELAALKQRVENGEEGDNSFFSGWQLQLRGSWHTLAHNHRDSPFKADDHQHGWGIGVGFMAPLWQEMASNVDLYGHLAIEYRQVGHGPHSRAPITGASGTISYMNVTVAPTVRFNATDTIRPFVFGGFNMQVASPPEDSIGYLDLGAVLGGGIDLRVHERISVGVEYKYNWFGVADQEEEDYGQLTGYVAFNF